jgi:hypothetical protein
MVTIEVKNIVNNYSDNQSGLIILDKIKRAFEVNQTVVVSFESVPYVSTSFVNSAFINLLSDYSFERIREDLKIINSNSQINSLIKNRFAFETSKIAVV